MISTDKVVSDIKVIKNNFGKEEEEIKTVTTICYECDSELEVSEEDTYIGWLGARFATCPCCGSETMVDEMDGITLTKDNLEYPKHFLHESKYHGCKEVSTEFILGEIKRAIEYMRTDKDCDAIEFGSGDSSIHVYKYSGDNEYHVIVTRDWYETDIPFEAEDYE